MRMDGNDPFPLGIYDIHIATSSQCCLLLGANNSSEI